jgi:hypothetical protein
MLLLQPMLFGLASIHSTFAPVSARDFGKALNGLYECHYAVQLARVVKGGEAQGLQARLASPSLELQVKDDSL